ncbi:hypothetical protein MIC448_260028 [Microbacterium sp. C448]|nr:hypothetical protein MIC448_260028 [Microbacterium sp. C448]
MSARADAAALTGERIVDAMLERLRTTPYELIRLEDVASDAGVTAQTVIRRFGNKPVLMTTTVERELGRIVARREAAMRASPAETMRALVEHYEDYGLLILKTYSEAPLVPGLPELAAHGRAYHVDWCRRAFAAHLAPPTERGDNEAPPRRDRRGLRRDNVAHPAFRRQPERRGHGAGDRRTSDSPAPLEAVGSGTSRSGRATTALFFPSRACYSALRYVPWRP